MVGKALRGVLAQAQIDNAFAQEFHQFLDRRRAPLLQRIAAEHPEWSQEELDGAGDALFSPVLYRLLMRGLPVNAALIRELIDRPLGPYAVEQSRKRN